MTVISMAMPNRNTQASRSFYPRRTTLVDHLAVAPAAPTASPTTAMTKSRAAAAVPAAAAAAAAADVWSRVGLSPCFYQSKARMDRCETPPPMPRWILATWEVFDKRGSVEP